MRAGRRLVLAGTGAAVALSVLFSPCCKKEMSDIEAWTARRADTTKVKDSVPPAIPDSACFHLRFKPKAEGMKDSAGAKAPDVPYKEKPIVSAEKE
ncbi:MAG: hypothetical protein WC717_02165 [Candidatus Micrarchaeia archaeon]|jgi:hypothetical protein